MGMFSFIGDIIGDITGASGVEEAAKGSAASTLEAQKRVEALNRERYQLAQGYMTPFVDRSNIASQQLMSELGLSQDQEGFSPRDMSDIPGWQEFSSSSDMSEVPGWQELISAENMSQVPGYQAVMDESLRAAEQSAVSSGSTAYGGRRLKAAGEVGAGVQQEYYNQHLAQQRFREAQNKSYYDSYIGQQRFRETQNQSYYNNYMNMLQNLSSPTTATNLASMGMNQGLQMGQQNIAATNTANQYMMGGASARQAGFGDLLGGAAGIFSGALAGGYI